MEEIMITSGQLEVLDTALDIEGDYWSLADKVLGYMDVTDLPPEIKHAVRAMAYRMASFNGGRPDAGIILHTILRAGWDTIGAPDTTALTLEERQGLVLVILSVCRGIIEAERARLLAVVELDTDFPELEPEPAE